MNRVTVTKVPHQKENEIQDPRENRVAHALKPTPSSQKILVFDLCINLLGFQVHKKEDHQTKCPLKQVLEVQHLYRLPPHPIHLWEIIPKVPLLPKATT